MAYQKNPSYLWQHSSGLWHLKRPIPPKLQQHYPSKTPGKFLTHWVESLGTHSRAEAEKLKRAPLRLLEAEFTRHSSGLVSRATSRHAERLASLRQSMADILKDGGDEGSELAIMDMAVEAAEAMEADHGPHAASMAFKLATQPGKLTLREALAERHKGATTREQTKAAEARALADLLEFLGVPDCLPEAVTEAKALQFVDALNDGDLSHATKKGRLSCLGRLWKSRKVASQLPRALHTLWEGHDVKGQRKSTAETTEEAGRVWTSAEMIKVFAAADARDKRQRTYTRPLFRELYALGFITGMRLDEVTSLRPADLAPMEGGIVVNIRKAKTAAGLRAIPVVHPVAVRVLQARAAAQKDPKGLLFSECQPGGPDNKTSWHVSKALGKDRARLGLDAVTFHSTRATFMTLQENAGTNHVHVQRYVGHVIDTVMHTDYSAGANVGTLKAIAQAVKFPAEVEEAWCEAKGFDMDRRYRADAMWLAENPGVVSSADNGHADPTHIRSAHRKAQAALKKAEAAPPWLPKPPGPAARPSGPPFVTATKFSRENSRPHSEGAESVLPPGAPGRLPESGAGGKGPEARRGSLRPCQHPL